mmetsp:Transcript_11628/g.17270  ORF Transcript_11628/g.17270 Transcript_11628/m.17270 type:complete len:128 (-) Transcript_11628:4-387(-)
MQYSHPIRINLFCAKCFNSNQTCRHFCDVYFRRKPNQPFNFRNSRFASFNSCSIVSMSLVQFGSFSCDVSCSIFHSNSDMRICSVDADEEIVLLTTRFVAEDDGVEVEVEELLFVEEELEDDEREGK